LVTIAGTNFVSGATVNFVNAAGTVVSSYVTVTSNKSITAVAPPVTAGASSGSSPGPTYFVTVTADGTSPTVNAPSDEYYYYPIYPTVASLSPNSQPTNNGGTPVTITGTGFFTGATVQFVQENLGNVVVGGANRSAGNIVVVNATTITCTSPSISTGSTYFVYVTTPDGGSSTNNAVYTY